MDSKVIRFFERESDKKYSYTRQVWYKGEQIANFCVPIGDKDGLEKNLVKQLDKLKVGERLSVKIEEL